MVERLFLLKAVSHAGTTSFEGNYILARAVEFPWEASWLFAVVFRVLRCTGEKDAPAGSHWKLSREDGGVGWGGGKSKGRWLIDGTGLLPAVYFSIPCCSFPFRMSELPSRFLECSKSQQGALCCWEVCKQHYRGPGG